MKRVEGVWAELSAKQEVALSEVQKVELATATEIKALVKIVEKQVDDAEAIWKEYASLLDQYNRIRTKIEPLGKRAAKLDDDIFEDSNKLYRAENQMINSAKELGVDANMVKSILRDLKIDVDGLLRIAVPQNQKMQEVARVSKAMPEIK